MARKSAEQRREEIVGIALRQFAEGGYHGTSTEAIAREAGISQPYLFRLFGTKRELFLACLARCHDNVVAVFAEAAAAAEPEDRLDAMGKAYVERLLPDRHALLFQIQSYAAGGSEPALRDPVRKGYGDLVREVSRLAGVPLADTWEFFASGMLMNVLAALDIGPKTEAGEWALEWAAP